MAQQMTTYTILIAGLSLVFYFMGLVPSNPFIDILFRPNELTTVTFISGAVSVTLLGLLALAAATSVFVGFFVRYVDLIAKATLLAFLIPLLWNIGAVFLQVWQYNAPLAILLFSPALFNYLFVVIPDWWSGRD